jgi:hypothetical protein
MDELAMELGDEIGMLEHNLGHESARLEITSPFELE